MSADLVELGGYLLSSWVLGYAMGFLFYAVRRLFDTV